MSNLRSKQLSIVSHDNYPLYGFPVLEKSKVIDEFINRLKIDKDLEFLNISECKMTEGQIINLCKSIQNHPRITSVDFGDFEVPVKCLENLLTKNKNIITIVISKLIFMEDLTRLSRIVSRITNRVLTFEIIKLPSRVLSNHNFPNEPLTEEDFPKIKINEELLEKALDCNEYFQTDYFSWVTTLLALKKNNWLNLGLRPLKIIADFAGVLYKSSYQKLFTNYFPIFHPINLLSP